MRKALIVMVVLLSFATVMAQNDDIPLATIINDEGGPVSISGDVSYTNSFFTMGVDEPLVILEDQGGFVTRNRRFIMSEESQVLGKITSDFYTSPFRYAIELPIVPAATLHDVDTDDESDPGVMIYAIAYWTNVWGDAYLEERDLYGGGWSSAYASTRVSPDPSDEGEIIGGTFLVYAPDDQQAFPTAFGDDGKLFTGDEPVVRLPPGYTLVNLDSEPFTFDRSRNPVVDLIEGEGSEQDDFSNLSYGEAFDAMVEMFRQNYAFTEFLNIDWDAKRDEYRPRFVDADRDGDADAYRRALRDFIFSIPDGHLSAPFDANEFWEQNSGGLGLTVRQLDDGRVIVRDVFPDTPADDEGIEVGAEILGWNGMPIEKALEEVPLLIGPFSTQHVRRINQLAFLTRMPIDSEVVLKYRNPGDEQTQTSGEMNAIEEFESYEANFGFLGWTEGGFDLPVEYELLPSGFAVVRIYSFSDSDRLMITIWERLMRELNNQGVPGLIIDMRYNGGGSGWLADQMAAYFFDEALTIGNSASFDESVGGFYSNPDYADKFILPGEELRYSGPIAVLVGPNCASACEFFAYNMTIDDRATIVGQYPSAGLGGGQSGYNMPEGETLQYSIIRPLDSEGNIIIEGSGIVPEVKVPVDEESIFSDEDLVLQAAVDFLNGER